MHQSPWCDVWVGRSVCVHVDGATFSFLPAGSPLLEAAGVPVRCCCWRLSGLERRQHGLGSLFICSPPAGLRRVPRGRTGLAAFSTQQLGSSSCRRRLGSNGSRRHANNSSLATKVIGGRKGCMPNHPTNLVRSTSHLLSGFTQPIDFKFSTKLASLSESSGSTSPIGGSVV